MTERVNEAIWIESRQRWQINIQKDGERRTFTSSTPDKKGKIDAEKKADKWLESRSRNENIRFPQLWNEFLEDRKENTGTSNYKQLEYIGRLYFSPIIKHKKAKDIIAQDWQDCIDAAYKKGLSKKTCQDIRGAMTQLYRYAKKRKIPMERPEDITIQKDAKVNDKTILQPDDIKNLFSIDYIVHHNKKEPAFYIHAWRFILLTGLRRGELCGLDKVDLEDDILYIRRSINGFEEVTKGKTENAKRYIMLSGYSRQVLEDQSKMLKERGIISPYLFPDEEGNRTNPMHLYDKWKTYRDQNNIKCSLHELRHTMISVAKADVPEQLLKKMVGHSKSMDTFGTYGHTVDGEMERASKILDGVFELILK